MTATIHYLHPFEREDLSKTEAAEPVQESPGESRGESQEESQAADDEAPAPEKTRTRRHLMPCGRNSRFKKRMDGTVVPRDKR